MRCIIDEFTREALAIRVARRLRTADVVDALSDLFILRGAYRLTYGPTTVLNSLLRCSRLGRRCVGAKTAYIEPGSPWENGYCESFNGKLREELPNREILYTLKKAQIMIEGWRRHYNTIRPHSSLDYRPPAPEALFHARPPAQPEPAPPGARRFALRRTLN